MRTGAAMVESERIPRAVHPARGKYRTPARGLDRNTATHNYRLTALTLYWYTPIPRAVLTATQHDRIMSR